MNRRFSGKQIFAAFVLAFLCLNVGGALCLTYCSQIMAAPETAEAASHLSDHCRRARREAEEREKNSSKIEAGEASCCMMPVAFFAAPIEKRPEVKAHSVVAVPASPRFGLPFQSHVLTADRASAQPVYRPPPLDRRIERELNCVIRI